MCKSGHFYKFLRIWNMGLVWLVISLCSTISRLQDDVLLAAIQYGPCFSLVLCHKHIFNVSANFFPSHHQNCTRILRSPPFDTTCNGTSNFTGLINVGTMFGRFWSYTFFWKMRAMCLCQTTGLHETNTLLLVWRCLVVYFLLPLPLTVLFRLIANISYLFLIPGSHCEN